MKLDYKLIIILGLSVVIYFIYKEVDSLFDKLTTLEDRIKVCENNSITVDETLLIAPVINEEPIVDFNEYVAKKSIIIDLNTTLNNNYDVIYSHLTDSNSKYLEIYSNDNSSYNTSIKENIISEDIIIEDSIKSTSNVVFDYDTKSPETKSPETKSPETKSPETKSPEPKSPETKSPETKSPETKSPETKSPETKSPEPKSPEPKSPEPKSPEPKSPEPKSPKMNELSDIELKNKKMGDIIKIAQENNIDINKKVNGMSKKKVKQELINEIIQKKISK
jgi:hypothetical protein